MTTTAGVNLQIVHCADDQHATIWAIRIFGVLGHRVKDRCHFGSGIPVLVKKENVPGSQILQSFQFSVQCTYAPFSELPW